MSESNSATTTSASGSRSSQWPLHKISEPHSFNDVLWSDEWVHLAEPEAEEDEDAFTMPSTKRETSGTKIAKEESVPWRSEERMKRWNSHNSGSRDLDLLLQGNARFREMLLSSRQEFETKNPMERPLVALKILNEWRNQTPPGRFLVVEPNTNPPLYKDMGDKKARNKISKALKHLVSQSNNSSNDNNKESQEDRFQKLSHDDHNHHEEKKTTDWYEGPRQHLAVTPLPLLPPPKLLPPKIPRFQKPNKNERRISEQLHTAQKDGRLFGRWKERDRLMAVFKQLQQQHLQYQERQQRHCLDHRDSNTLSDCALSTEVATEITKVPLVLISGSLGIGKTCLARTLQNPLVDDGTVHVESDTEEEEEGTCTNTCNNNKQRNDHHHHSQQQQQDILPFFLEGKFQHCQWEDPNAVFVALMADFCIQLYRRQELVHKYRLAISQALPDDLALLIQLVPALAPILNINNNSNKQNNVGSAAENETTEAPMYCPGDPNYGMAMQHTKQVFTTFFGTIGAVSPDQNPVIVLLDDLHWASEPAMEVFQFIITEITSLTKNCGIVFVATYLFDDGCDYLEPHFTRALEQIKADHRVIVHDVVLGNLREESVNLMLSEALSLTPAETQQVKDLIFPVTKGNPTFITELLRLFQERDIIRYDETTMHWTCSFDQIPATLSNIQNMADLFRAKIQALPPSVQETLRIAACLLSTQINESILKLVDTLGAVAAHLKVADMQGLLKYRDEHYYFASDSVKQAVLDLIPENDRAAYHLKIGQRMWLHLQENQSSEFYSNLINQMMLSDHLVVEEEDRRSLATLYLEAGQGAMLRLGFQTAWYCLSRGIKTMKPLKKWGRDNYDLSLTLYNKAIEVCYCNGEFSQLDTLIEEVLQNARTFQDSLPARSTKIYSLGSRNKQVEAIKLALDTLKKVDQHFPSMQPSYFWILLEGRRVGRLLHHMSDEDILRLPRMKDPNKAAALQIMNHVFLHTAMVSPALAALMVFRMVELTVKHGLSAMASIGFGLYGYFLSSRFGDINGGVRYGKLSLKLAERLKSSVWLGRTMMCYFGTVYPRKYPVEGAWEPLRTANRLAMRSADIEYAVMTSCIACWQNAEILRLPVLENNVRQALKESHFYKQSLSLMMIKPLLQYTLILMGLTSGDPKYLRGELVDDDVKEAEANNDKHYLMWFRYCGMRLAYIFSDYDLADSLSDTAADIYNLHEHCGLDAAEALFYHCLVLLVQVRRNKRSRFSTLRYVKRRLKKLKMWAYHAPSNFLHKQYLLQAEIAVTVGHEQEARAHYRSAILQSRERNFYLEEALANESLGKLYLKENDLESAVPLFEDARKVYERWGAKAKLEHFEKEYGDVLGCLDNHQLS